MAETSVLLGLAGVTVSRDGAQLLADVQLTVT